MKLLEKYKLYFVKFYLFKHFSVLRIFYNENYDNYARDYHNVFVVIFYNFVKLFLRNSDLIFLFCFKYFIIIYSFEQNLFYAII